MIRTLLKKESYFFILPILMGMIFSVQIYAANTDRSLGFQGQLFSNGTPLTGPANTTFTFYTDLTGTTTQTGSTISKTVAVSNGYFSTQFSSSDTTNVDFNQQLYLEVTVNGTTLSPRSTITSNPSSLKTFGVFSSSSTMPVGPSGSLYYNASSSQLFVSNGTSWVNAGSNPLQWQGSGSDLYFNTGNVSVGTTSTSSKLTIGGTIGATSLSVSDATTTRSNLGVTFASNSDFSNSTNIGTWGDSLTAGAGGTPYPTQLASLTGSTVYNGGVGGQTSSQIGVRQGGVSVTVTVASSSIPSSGGVVVTFPTGFEPVTTQGPAGGTYGTISGVYGLVTLSSGVYTFTRSVGGSVTSVSGSVPFVVDTFNKNAGSVIIWAGRNNLSDGTQVKADVAAMVASLGHTRYIVMGITNGSTEVSGSGTYNTIVQLNNELATIYGTHFIDIRAYLVSQYNSGDAQDIIDYGNDVIPTSLRSDAIHLNTAGYLKVAQRVYQSIAILQPPAQQNVLTSTNIASLFANPNIIGSTTPNIGYFSQIGIGTQTLVEKLNVAGNILITNGSYLYGYDQSGNKAGIARIARIALSTNDLYLGGTYVGNVFLGTGSGNQKMTITNAGNVGIGTTTPFTTLGVVGTSYFSGNMGIGTTTPGQLFVVNGTSQFMGTVFVPNASAFYQTANTGTFFAGNGNVTGNAGAVTIAAAGSNQNITLTPSGTGYTLLNGNVGIGTSSPQEKLHVQGNILLNNGSYLYGYDLSGNKTGIARIAVSTNDLYLGGTFVGNVFLGTGTGNQKMTISNAGSVGIGTTTPTATLTASGTIRFTSLTGAGANLVVDSLGNVTVSSDERLKNIQGNFISGLDKIKGITPILYKWKEETGYDASNTYAGFSAQNIQANIPEAVSTDARGFLTLADRPILAALVNAVKEIATMIEGFKDKFTTKELCLDDVCITKDQLKVLLQQSGQRQGVQAPQPQPDPTISTSTEVQAIVETPTQEEVVVPPAAPVDVPASEPIPSEI